MNKVTYECSLNVRSWINDDGFYIPVCDYVYEPAEDTWLAYRLLKKTCKKVNIEACIDVGTGTGVLGLSCTSFCPKVKRIIAIDINPCAIYCAKTGFEKNYLDVFLDAVQCDRTSCLREFSENTPITIVYNTPYLPVKDDCHDDIDCLYSLSWSGGISEALGLIKEVSRFNGRACFILVFSSLSYPNGDSLTEVVKEISRRKLLLREVLKEHLFFEDIYALLACNYQANA